MKRRVLGCTRLFLVIIALLSGIQAKADVWTGPVNLKSIEPEDVGGTLLLIVVPSQPVINPAGCGLSEFYVVADPLLFNVLSGLTMTALSTATQVDIEITTTSSSNTCVDGQPTVTTMTLL